MWVSWVVARQVVVWVLVGALVFVGLPVSFFLLAAVFPD